MKFLELQNFYRIFARVSVLLALAAFGNTHAHELPHDPGFDHSCENNERLVIGYDYLPNNGKLVFGPDPLPGVRRVLAMPGDMFVYNHKCFKLRGFVSQLSFFEYTDFITPPTDSIRDISDVHLGLRDIISPSSHSNLPGLSSEGGPEFVVVNHSNSPVTYRVGDVLEPKHVLSVQVGVLTLLATAWTESRAITIANMYTHESFRDFTIDQELVGRQFLRDILTNDFKIGSLGKQTAVDSITVPPGQSRTFRLEIPVGALRVDGTDKYHPGYKSSRSSFIRYSGALYYFSRPANRDVE